MLFSNKVVRCSTFNCLCWLFIFVISKMYVLENTSRNIVFLQPLVWWASTMRMSIIGILCHSHTVSKRLTRFRMRQIETDPRKRSSYKKHHTCLQKHFHIREYTYPKSLQILQVCDYMNMTYSSGNIHIPKAC
jgi:hypothetical protein